MQRSSDPESPGRYAVMIVDDHAHFRCAMRNWLAGLHPDWELIDAETGEDALALAGRRGIDLALMDLGLPGMDGIEVTRRIMALCPRTHIIVLTDHDEPCLRRQAEAAGAGGCVLKSRACDDLEPLLARIPAQSDRAMP